MKKISEKKLYEQQHLTFERLSKKLTPILTELDGLSKRPENSLVELMTWAKKVAGVTDCQYTTYSHDKIIVDGNFLQYCEENDVEVNCILKDCISSWESDHNCENFIAQGIFKIKKDNLEFIQCSLLYKGESNNDDVAFFVIAHNKMYEPYIKFRNDYDKWRIERESNVNEIFVAGGSSIQYESDLSWDDVFLDDETKDEVKSIVEGFLNNKNFYKENNIPWKRGCIFYGPPGCGKTLLLKIIMSQYKFKPVTFYSAHPQVDELMLNAFSYAEEHGPSLLFIEDLPELLQRIEASTFLQILDGVKTREGLFIIATANDIHRIHENIMDRPSRFDRKIEFKLPNKELTVLFLKKFLKDNLTDKEYNLIATKTVKSKFSFAHLKEMYITASYISLSDNNALPKYKEIEKAYTLLNKNKKDIQHGFSLGRSVDLMENY